MRVGVARCPVHQCVGRYPGHFLPRGSEDTQQPRATARTCTARAARRGCPRHDADDAHIIGRAGTEAPTGRSTSDAAGASSTSLRCPPPPRRDGPPAHTRLPARVHPAARTRQVAHEHRQGGAFGVWCASTGYRPNREPHRPRGHCSEAASAPANFKAFLHRRVRCAAMCCHTTALVPSMGFRPLRGSRATAAEGQTHDTIPRPVATEPNPKKRHVARRRLSGVRVRRTVRCDGPPWGL